MPTNSTVIIDNQTYEVLDAKEKITVPDCIVRSTNKIWSASWESKIYLGQENQETLSFFGQRWFSIRCVVKRDDLLIYLENVKEEYLNQQFPYWKAYNDRMNEKRVNKKERKPLSELRDERKTAVESLDEFVYFTLNDQPQIEPPRVYANSNEEIQTLIRKLALPHITYLAALKLTNPEGEILYYLRLFEDYFNIHENSFVQQENEILEDTTLDEETRENVVKARKWQGKYRCDLLEECPYCPITLIADDRLLIASHIKPWAHSEPHEKIDPKNGFMFTPTYDFLFDRGYISFSNEKEIIISPWLSKFTCSKLNIAPGKKFQQLPIEWREQYMEYHREHIFKW